MPIPEEKHYAPVGAYNFSIDENGLFTIVPIYRADRTVTVTKPEEYINPEFIITPKSVKSLVDDTGKPAYSVDAYNIVLEEKHKPLNPYQYYMESKGVAPKDVETEHLMQRYRSDLAADRSNLSPFFANLLTGGYATAAQEGWNNIKNGKYFTGAAEVLSPLMFGENAWNRVAQGVYGGIHLLNENGVPKTWEEIKKGNYGRAALSGAGDALNLLLLRQGYMPERWRTAWYNNLTPGSYSSNISWNPKGKIVGEAPQALKDYFSFWKELEQNPKWYEYLKKGDIKGFDMWQEFPINDPKINAELRKEAFLIYQGMEHTPKYILDTGRVDTHGNKIYTLNLKEIPDSGLTEYVKRISNLKEGTGVTSDLGNYGGNVSYNKQINGNQFTFTIDDLFDVLPLLNPGRIAEKMPKWMSNILFKQITNPSVSKYTYSYEHRGWVPNWLKNLEIGKITGGKPFRSITTLEGDVLKEYPKAPTTSEIIQLKKQHLVDTIISDELELVPFEELPEEEIEGVVNNIRQEAVNKVNSMPDEVINRLIYYDKNINPALNYYRSTGRLGMIDNKTTVGSVRGIESTPVITEENARLITPEQWTTAQDAAIIRGDMAEAQRLRDLHFRTYAPYTKILDERGNPIHSYHGTGVHFNIFDTTGKYSTLDEGYYGKGSYFAPNRELAQMYADTEKTPIVYDTYLNIKNPLRHIRDENADLYGKAIINNDGVISKLPDDLVDESFDMTEFIATKPNQIKLADAVTYDDNGIKIPLGERDNFTIDDMRYFSGPSGQLAPRPVNYLSTSPQENPLLSRMMRLSEKRKVGDVAPNLTAIFKLNVSPRDIVRAVSENHPELNSNQIELITQTLMNNKRGAHIPIGNNAGETTGGISIVEVEDAIKYLKSKGIKNPTERDIRIILGHEMGHGVKLTPEALNAVKGYEAPEEFYTQIGQVLDNAGITTTQDMPVQFNDLLKLGEKYLAEGNLDNGVSKALNFLKRFKGNSVRDIIKQQNMMRLINRFSVGILGIYAGSQLANNDGKVL